MDEKFRKNKDKEQTILGIRVIDSIVSKVISNPSEILSGLKQILFFYKLLPKEWKEKAYRVFERLWSKKKVIISTNPEKAEQIYEIEFEDDRLKNLYKLLPQNDKAIMLQGKSMIELIKKGLHSESDKIKIEVEERYGQRGLNIVNMLTTNDIQLLLKEIEDKKILSEKEIEKIFNEWSLQYDSISLLASPEHLMDENLLEMKIVELAKKSKKDCILINLSGKMEDCTKLIEIVDNLKEKKKLKYEKFEQDISDSGFCKSIKIKIIF